MRKLNTIIAPIILFISILSLIIHPVLIISADESPIEWKNPVVIEIDSQKRYQNPQIVSIKDHCYLVWESQLTSTGESQILFSSYNGTMWDNPISLSKDTSTNNYPSITIVNDQIFVVWTQLNIISQKMELFLRQYDGITWQVESKIPTDEYTLDYIQQPKLVAENNQLHLVWAGNNINKSTELYYSKLDNSVWQNPMKFGQASNPNSQISVSMVVRNDQIHIIYSEQQNLTSTIYYQLFDGSIWHEPEPISSFGYNPVIVIDNEQKIHVIWETIILGGEYANSEVWEQYEYDIYYRQFNGITWEPIQGVSEIGPLHTEFEVHYPAISHYQGKLYTIWLDFIPKKTYQEWTLEEKPGAVMFGYYDGNSWQPEEVVEEKLGHHTRSTLSMDQDVLHLIWMDVTEPGEGSSLYHRIGKPRSSGLISWGEGYIMFIAIVIISYWRKNRSKKMY